MIYSKALLFCIALTTSQLHTSCAFNLRRPAQLSAPTKTTTRRLSSIFKTDTNNSLDRNAIMAKQTEKREKILHMLHIFTSDLILQVFGGAGAIWGFSEVIGLRTPETVWFWRPFASFVGAVFFARWIVQLDAHIKEENIELFPKRIQQLEVTVSDEEQKGLCDEPASIAMQSTGKDYNTCK